MHNFLNDDYKKLKRVLFILLCSMLCHLLSFGQESIAGDTLRPGTYDTLQIELRSKVSFPFCSKTYNLPQECDINYPPNCCSYSTTLQKNEKVALSGFVSCGNGSSLNWFYNATFEGAKSNFENIPVQWEKQQKTFSKRSIKCFVMGKPTEAYLIEQETYQGFKFYTLITYGSNNGFNFTLQHRSQNKLTSSEDIPAAFKGILRIE